MAKTMKAAAASHSMACKTSHGQSSTRCCFDVADHSRRASEMSKTMHAVTGMARKSYER